MKKQSVLYIAPFLCFLLILVSGYTYVSSRTTTLNLMFCSGNSPIYVSEGVTNITIINPRINLCNQNLDNLDGNTLFLKEFLSLIGLLLSVPSFLISCVELYKLRKAT